MISQVGYKRKTVKVDNREFLVQIVQFDNGNFISITEGIEKLGALVVSIGTGTRTTSATVIPSKLESPFIKMVSERIALAKNGICIVSINTKKELELQIMKVLMNEIMELIK